MSIAAVGALANSLVAGQSARRMSPALGLAFRFVVKVDGLELGAWQSCTGLSVDFKPAELKSGGHYTGPRFLPGETTYPRVVLRRAAVKGDSEKVQTWLRDHARAWLEGSTVEGSGATISLYDAHNELVMWWQLESARPAAWKGPDLDAVTSKVALETLELVHEGFTVGFGTPPPTPPAPPDTGAGGFTLSEGAAKVDFRFPPTEIAVQKTQESRAQQQTSRTNVNNQLPAEGDQALDHTTNEPNITVYVLNNLVLDGPGVKGDVARLDHWATKTPVDPQRPRTLPDITFSWGTGFQSVPVHLTSLTVTYTRFDARGEPRRARVSLKLEERVAGEGGSGAQNPTSGGIPGRASHVLLQTESLPGLAAATYGAPGQWRAIARSNGIDDPLRVAPGTVLLLPAPSEVDS